MDVLLAEDGRLECPRLPARLEPELFVQPHPKLAVAAERLVRAVECVEREHLGAVGALAEAVERGRGLGMGERRREVELGERGVGGVEAGAEHPALVAAAHVEGPGRRRARPPVLLRGRGRVPARATARARSVGSRAERSSSSSKRSRSSETSSVANRYASLSVTTSSRARSRSGVRWRRSVETNVWSEPATFCGRSSPQTSSARRSIGTRCPRAVSRISSTCFGRTPPRSPAPSVRSPSSIESEPNSRIIGRSEFG